MFLEVETPLKKGTKIKHDDKFYLVTGCLDKNWLRETDKYTLVLKEIKTEKLLQ